MSETVRMYHHVLSWSWYFSYFFVASRRIGVVCLFVPSFLDGGGLALDEAADGELVARPHPLPQSATRKGPSAGEASSSSSATNARGAPATSFGTAATIALSGSAGGGGGGSGGGGGLGTGPGARQSESGTWAEGAARRREARREEAASVEWVNATRTEVAGLCEVAAKPFWQVLVWYGGSTRFMFYLSIRLYYTYLHRLCYSGTYSFFLSPPFSHPVYAPLWP